MNGVTSPVRSPSSSAIIIETTSPSPLKHQAPESPGRQKKTSTFDRNHHKPAMVKVPWHPTHTGAYKSWKVRGVVGSMLRHRSAVTKGLSSSRMVSKPIEKWHIHHSRFQQACCHEKAPSSKYRVLHSFGILSPRSGRDGPLVYHEGQV